MRRLDDNPAGAIDRGSSNGRAPSGPIVEVDGLNVTYGDFHAVEDLSFHVERGEPYALLGTNGAGKTSVSEVIEGHRRASSGDVRVFDHADSLLLLVPSLAWVVAAIAPAARMFGWEPRR